jgi:YggT family protein
MIAGALTFLIQTLGNLFVIAVLLRFMMQLYRVPFRNPFAQFIVAVTDFAVKPLRRLVPGLFGLDWACLLLAWLVELVVVTAGYRQGVAGHARPGGGTAGQSGGIHDHRPDCRACGALMGQFEYPADAGGL